MQAGTLRHRVIIQKPNAGTANEYNERATSWSAHSLVWASISSVSPKESEYAKRFATTVSHVIETRYVAGVKPTFRVNFEGRIFLINGVVNEDEQNIKLILYATEII